MVYSYGANQLIDTLFRYQWNSVSATWDNMYKYSYIYNSMGILVYEDWQTYNHYIPEWRYSQKTEYTYTITNQTQDIVLFTWISNAWDSFRLDHYSYTANQLNDSIIISYKNYSTGEMDPYLRRGFLYDAQERIIDEMEISWDIAQSLWYTSNRTTYQYNSDNDLSEIMRYQGDFTIPWRKRVPSYDSQVSVSELILPPDISFHKMKIGTDGEVYRLSDSAWHSNSTESLYYSDVINSVNELKNPDGVTVFPNPTSSFIQFKIGNQSKNLSLMIFSVNGAIVFNKHITSNQIVSLSQLVNGQYIYQIFDGEKHYTGTIIKN